MLEGQATNAQHGNTARWSPGEAAPGRCSSQHAWPVPFVLRVRGPVCPTQAPVARGLDLERARVRVPTSRDDCTSTFQADESHRILLGRRQSPPLSGALFPHKVQPHGSEWSRWVACALDESTENTLTLGLQTGHNQPLPSEGLPNKGYGDEGSGRPCLCPRGSALPRKRVCRSGVRALDHPFPSRASHFSALPPSLLWLTRV